MAIYTISDFSFSYPGMQEQSLSDISLQVESGQFIALCGCSGCGKSTLLRHLKTVLAPHGSKSGSILFGGIPLETVDQRRQSMEIGFVQQSPDNQLVTDKVWHELAFGLESLGMDSETIRIRVAEMASFFGIQTWFHLDVSQLSGGQKQLLNLAAVMVMQPKVLILDEPTSQLDPIAAGDFLETLAKINQELGTTIIISEHRLEEVLPLSDRVVVLDQSRLLVDAPPKEAARKLWQLNHDMFIAMPTPLKVWAAVSANSADMTATCPLTVRSGREWLSEIALEQQLDPQVIAEDKPRRADEQAIISLKEVSFRYQQDGADIVKNLSMNIYKGELFAIVGGNGVGKTTTLSLISGLNKPQRGQLQINGKSIKDIGLEKLYNGVLGVLPQNPQLLFVKKTVELDLYEMFNGRNISLDEQEWRVNAVSHLCELDDLLVMHPYDLSGGEQQRAALAKILLLAPQILLLDEPTKGLDGHFKRKLAGILRALTSIGVTIVMVSHDIEFCAEYADRCAMFFDGSVVAEHGPRRFFSGQTFYTTSASRMSRHLLPNAVLAVDIIEACGGRVENDGPILPTDDIQRLFAAPAKTENLMHNFAAKKTKDIRKRLTPRRIFFGLLMVLLFIITIVYSRDRCEGWQQYLAYAVLLLEAGVALSLLLPGQTMGVGEVYQQQLPIEQRKFSKRTMVAMLMILIAIPLTIYFGIYYLADRKYYFITMLVILETMLPFVMVYEGRKPQARELVIIAVLCAIAVAGRAAFFMIPQFKPVVALVIITGVCFGGEAGFLVGAITGFVSNIFFVQGPWTPWQMFAFGVIGFLAGILFRKGLLRKRRGSLCIFGGLATLLIYGGIMNPAAVLMFQSEPTKQMFLLAYALGLPFDLIHATATVFFLYLISAPMINKLERIKIKYGLLEG